MNSRLPKCNQNMMLKVTNSVNLNKNPSDQKNYTENLDTNRLSLLSETYWIQERRIHKEFIPP